MERDLIGVAGIPQADECRSDLTAQTFSAAFEPVADVTDDAIAIGLTLSAATMSGWAGGLGAGDG